MRHIDADEFVARMYAHGVGVDPETCEGLISIADVQRILLEVPTVEPNPGWISVKDRLPDRLDEYLVVNCGKVGLAIYHDGLWFAPTRNVEITHWMPLPEPPKMEGGETDE